MLCLCPAAGSGQPHVPGCDARAAALLRLPHSDSNKPHIPLVPPRGAEARQVVLGSRAAAVLRDKSDTFGLALLCKRNENG